MTEIDYKNVITKEDLYKIQPEKYIYLLQEFKNNYVNQRLIRGKNFSSDYLIHHFENRVKELIYNNPKYAKESTIWKELLFANICYYNDEKLINYLISKGINYFKLGAYTRLISKTKEAYLLNKQNDDDIILADKRINQLINLINSYYQYGNFNSIITKLNYLYVFKKDLYKQLEKNKTKH